MSQQIIFKDETKIEIKKPNMYKVIIHNDDYTTMDFVVEVLIKVFHKKTAEATRIMFDVHKKGKGLVGVYTYDVAATKILQVEKMCEEREFPLKVTMEEE